MLCLYILDINKMYADWNLLVFNIEFVLSLQKDA